MVKNIMQIPQVLNITQVKTKRPQYYEEENLPQNRTLETSGTAQ